MSDTLAPERTSGRLDIVRIGGSLGAELRELKLAGDIDEATVEAIRQALWQHKVLFIRGQQHLDDQSHEAFAKRLGTPVTHPTVPVEGGDYLLELDSHRGGKANSWHTDITFVAEYPAASILRAVSIPEFGGDTVWANTVTAYERLPAPLKRLADSLRAIHSNDYDYAANQIRPDSLMDEYQEMFIATIYEAEHPLVRIHPETGERSLVLGSFFKQFVGLNQDDSRHLYAVFQSHITRLENTVRWRWQEGDVAIWDNRATQHYAIDDYGDQRRIVRRVTIRGDVPVGIDGPPSRQVKP